MMIGILCFLMVSLAPCPNKPNCISSQEEDRAHAIAPFPIYKSPQESLGMIASIIRMMPRTKIVEATQDYLHAEFTSKIFRFIDDVEFLYNPNKNVIDVRSASRVGYGDLGVNRKRVEALHEAYNKRIREDGS